MAVRERRLELRGARERLQVQIGHQADRGDPHVRAAPLRLQDGRVPPGCAVVQREAGVHAGIAGRAIVVGAVQPADEPVAQRLGERLRCHLTRVDERPRERERHLGVVGDERRIAGQFGRSRRPVHLLDPLDRPELG
jgi:hypothetical protein